MQKTALSYTFKWKHKSPFWQKRQVRAHRYDDVQNKMILYFPNGAVEEIARWSDCSLKLGEDWVYSLKLQESAKISVARNVKAS